MCTILIAHQVSEQQPLLVLANRDEFYSRPTAAAAEWQDMPSLIAGRDLLSGGTWFGARNRRWASITNVREGIRNENEPKHQKSRGWLVLDYLQSSLSPERYLQKIEDIEDEFAGYNLLLGDGLELWYMSNRIHKPVHLEPGIYGLSNHLLDTLWPKVTRGKQELASLIETPGVDHNRAFSILADTTLAEDDELPDTGVPYSWEKVLSATFIKTPEYGTRCSTLLSFDKDRRYRFIERRYLDGPETWEESDFSWTA